MAADWHRKLVDFTEYRLPDMDRNDVHMQVLSLTSPGIQVQPDPDIAVADARTANDFLADIIKEHPQRFAGLAAIPLQDAPKEPGALVERVAALDIEKASLTECVRVPDEDSPGRAARRSVPTPRLLRRCWNCGIGWSARA